jgi:hypothetical protein
MSKVTRDGIIGSLATDLDSDAVSDFDAKPSSFTPPPRKRMELNATITLSEEALAALLEEVKSGRPNANAGASLDLDEPAPSASASATVAPAPAVVPEPWKRAPAHAKRKF